MKRAWIAVLIGLMVVAIGAPTAFAQGFGHGRGGGVAGFPWMLRNLNLTDAQKSQIRQITMNYRPQFRTLRQQLVDAQRQLGDKLFDPTSTADQLTPLADQVNQLRNQLEQLRVRMALDIRSVLSPDQVAKAAQTRQRLNQLRAEMRALVAPTP